jgi:hypothetical protein
MDGRVRAAYFRAESLQAYGIGVFVLSLVALAVMALVDASSMWLFFAGVGGGVLGLLGFVVGEILKTWFHIRSSR